MARAETAPAIAPSNGIEARSLPLPEVPLSQDRGALPKLHVAGHELNHALAAHALGIPVISISVNPEGNSLGRTILGGSFSMDQFKIVAAAGRVSTVAGAAEGFGSDIHKARLMAAYYGGLTVDEAENRAAGLISTYPFEIREKAAEIIAYMGEVGGGILPVIMARAAIEVDIEEGRTDFFISPDLEVDQPQQDFTETTIIDTLDAFTSKITTLEGGVVKDEKIVCNICFGESGHFPDCPIFQKKEVKFDKSGTIYTKDINLGNDSLLD